MDYLTVSIKKMKLNDLFKILKLDSKKMIEGYSRWLGKKYYLGGISVHYGDYIILEMTGSGCRLLESLYDNKLNWVDFIEQFLCLEGSHMARLDVAGDDYPSAEEKPLLSFDTMARHCFKKQYVSKATSKPKVTLLGEENIYFGSPQSDRRLRIYNKAMERGIDNHWIRVEFQLRNESALSFYMRALECGSIGQAYQGMLYDFLRFTREENDSEHTERLTVTRWWKTFCGNAKRIKGFYVGGLEYNMERLEHFLFKGAGSSMKTLLACSGGDVGKLVQFANDSEYNEKQDFLVKTQPLIDKMREDYKTDEEKAAENSRRIYEAIAGKVVEKGTTSHVEKMAMLYSKRTELKDKIRKDYCEYWGVPDPEEEEFKRCADEDLSFDV